MRRTRPLLASDEDSELLFEPEDTANVQKMVNQRDFNNLYQMHVALAVALTVVAAALVAVYGWNAYTTTVVEKLQTSGTGGGGTGPTGATGGGGGGTGWTFGICTSGPPSSVLCNSTYINGIYMCTDTNQIWMCLVSGWVYVDGLEGITGATGATGVSGTSGSLGSSGVSGGTGATGSSGASGGTGPSGSTGASGTTGMSGGTGYTGSSGATGMSGASGAIGFVNTTCQSVTYVANATSTSVLGGGALTLIFTNVTSGNLLITASTQIGSAASFSCPTSQASQITSITATFAVTAGVLSYRIQTFQVLNTASNITCTAFASGAVAVGQVYDGLRYSFKYGIAQPSLSPPTINWNGNALFYSAAIGASPITMSGFPDDLIYVTQASEPSSNITSAIGFYSKPYNGTIVATPFSTSAPATNSFAATIVNDCLYAFGNKK